MPAIRIVEYLEQDVSPFGRWFDRLDPVAAAKVATALYRLEHGNTSNVKAVGKGKVWRNTGLISVPATAFISGRMETL